MRRLKPLEIFIGGSVLLAIALPFAVAIGQPDARNAGAVIRLLVAGAIFGMFIFGFIAAGEGVRSSFVRRHFEQLERWSAFVMALGLGHWMGVMVGDTAIIWAFAFVILGACFRVYLDCLAKQPAA